MTTSSFTRMNRRSALQLIMGGAGVGLLAACAPAAAPAPTAKPASTSAPAPAAAAAPTVSGSPSAVASPVAAAPSAAPQPRSGGTLRYGTANDITRLDAHFRVLDAYYTVYDRLTQYDDALKPHPMLAESWEVASDSRQVKFNLRKGATFHNGKEIDAAAIKANSERARDLPNTQLAEAKWWSAIETPDKYTVIFKSDSPRPAMFDYFEFLNITDPATADDPKQAIGSGPFKFIEWVQGKSFTLQKNTNYWQTGKPYMDGIVVNIITDPQSMSTTLEAGQLDVASLSVQDFLRLQDKPGYRGYRFSGGNVSVIGVNTQSEPWTNKKARQALWYAINRDRWAKTINAGLEQPSVLPWTKESPAYDEAKASKYTFDLAKAKAMLTEAGVTGTYTGEIVFQTGVASYPQMAQVFQADMAQLGFTLQVKPMDLAGWVDTVNNGKYTGFWLGAGAFAHLDPALAFTKSRAFAPNGNSSSFLPPANANAVALVEKALSDGDLSKRKDYYNQLNDMLLDESYVFPMAPSSGFLMTSTRVNNVVPTKHSAQKWWEAWLS